MIEEKKKWRKQIQEQRKALTKQEWNRKNEQIHDRFLQLESWMEARRIGVYYSINRETDTRQIIQQGWKEEKSMYLPKCDPSTSQMHFYQIHAFDELESVYFGLQEPVPDPAKWIQPDELDLILVPGLVFDRNGYRIGYGGGYYDRYLVQVSPRTTKVSFAFQFQVKDEALPIEEHDQPVDRIITEKELIETKTPRSSSLPEA